MHQLQRVLQTAFLYFAVVYAATLLVSVLRLYWLAPALGYANAVFANVPILLTAMIFGAIWSLQRSKLEPSVGALLGVGLGAVFLQQCADVILGGGVNWSDPSVRELYFHTTPGLVYLAMLAAFAFMPILVWIARGLLAGRNSPPKKTG